jgi:ER membrane protein complex subunit 7
LKRVLNLTYLNLRRPDVLPGTYILSLLSHDHSFDHVCPTFLILSGTHQTYQVRIDVSPSEPLPEVRSYVFGTPLLTTSSVSLPYPVVLIPRHENKYFSPRDSFNLLGMFQSPMMMIMALTGGMMLAMPYIMVSFICILFWVVLILVQKNLDPETLDGLKGQQAKGANIQELMQSGDPRG